MYLGVARGCASVLAEAEIEGLVALSGNSAPATSMRAIFGCLEMPNEVTHGKSGFGVVLTIQ